MPQAGEEQGSRPPREEQRWALARAAVLLAALTAAFTWPLPAQLGSLPTSKLPTATVPLASSWALWWVADRLPHGLVGLWDAPIFFPAKGVFALSEPMVPLGILAAPLLWLGATPATAYGVLLLASVLGNGLAAWALLRWLGVHEHAALAGGALAVACPYTMHVLSVLTLVPLFGMLWTLQAGVALLRAPSPRTGALLGAALGVTYLICGHHALFLGLAGLPLAGALLERRHLARGTAEALLAATAALIVLVGWQAWTQHQVLATGGYERSAQAIGTTSANLWEWTHTAFSPLLPQPGIGVAPGSDRGLFPGYLRLGLAAAAWLGVTADRRRLVLGLWGMVFLAALLSWLPLLTLGTWTPWESLAAVVPGLVRVRAVWRFAGLVHLAVLLLAALGVDALLRHGRQELRWAAWALAALATVELWSPGVPLEPAPAPDRWAPFNEAVRAYVPEGAPLYHLPAMTAVDEDTLWRDEMQAVYLQTQHGHPVLNGYASYTPHQAWALMRAVAHWDGAALSAALAEADCRHLVVRPSQVPEGTVFGGYHVVFESTELDVRLLAAR